MKTITVYGPGCKKCDTAAEVIRQTLETMGAQATLVKVTDVRQMVTAGVMSTPAVAVDGVLKISGRIPTAEDVRGWTAGA